MADALGPVETAEVWKAKKPKAAAGDAKPKAKSDKAKTPAKTPKAKKTLEFDEDDEEAEVDLASMLDEKVVVSREVFKEFFGFLMEVDLRFRERLFIVQV